MMSLTDCGKKIKSHESELWLILSLLTTASLMLGLWQNFNKTPVSALVIENVPANPASLAGEREAILATQTAVVPSPAGGKLVASKNGTKYYLPTCSGVKRIKEENKIWFNSVAEAEARGLTPAANCPGLSE